MAIIEIPMSWENPSNSYKPIAWGIKFTNTLQNKTVNIRNVFVSSDRVDKEGTSIGFNYSKGYVFHRFPYIPRLRGCLFYWI